MNTKLENSKFKKINVPKKKKTSRKIIHKPPLNTHTKNTQLNNSTTPEGKNKPRPQICLFKYVFCFFYTPKKKEKYLNID